MKYWLLCAGIGLHAVAGFAQVERLDSGWTVKINGQSVRANADGSFLVPNIAAPDQFGPGGPGTAPDFVGDDPVRVLAVNNDVDSGEFRFAFSDPVILRQATTTIIEDLTFTNTPPPFPVAIRGMFAVPTLTEIGQTSQITLTATLVDGSPLDVTAASTGTIYRTSNTAIAAVNTNGRVTAVSDGLAFITGINEGATAVTRILVDIGAELTDVIGFVERADGTPVVGADISIVGLAGMTITDAAGRFVIAGVTADLGGLVVLAQFQNGETLFGFTDILEPVAGGSVDAGIIVVQTVCEFLGAGCVDTDGDGLPDNIESQLGLNPNSVDSDGDTIRDGAEDNDLDTLSNLAEVFLGTSANNIDTDSDGLTDATEFVNGLDPRVNNLGIDLTFDGDFVIPAGRSVTITANWIINGSTTVNGTLIVNGANASFTANGMTILAGGNIQALNGGDIAFPTFASSDGANLTLTTTLDSTIDFSTLTNFSNGVFTASGTGMIDISSLASVNTARFIASAGALLDLSLLTNVSWTSNNFSQPNIFESTGAGPASQGSPPSQILAPNVESISFTETACSGCNASAVANGTAILDLSGLTTITLPDLNDFFTFNVDSGGMMDLSSLETNDRGMRFTVAGASTLEVPALAGALNGSVITLSGDAMFALDAIDSISNTTFNITGNAILTSMVETITATSITLANTSMFEAPSLNTYTSGISAFLTVRDMAVFDAPNLADIDNSQFVTTGGGVINLPAVATYDWSGAAANPVIFSASGTGPISQGSLPSQINVPNLMTLGYVTDNCGGCRALITSSAGAEIDLSSLTTINVPDMTQFVDFSVDSGGSIDLSLLAINSRLRFTVSGASALDLPAFDGALTGGTFTLSGDATLTLDAVDSVTGTVFNMSGNAMLELASSATLSNDSFNLTGNAQVSLPLVQTITGTNIIIANTSVFDAPSLTAYNSGISAGLTVRDTAVFDAPNLADINNSQFATTGGGVIDLPAVTAYDWSGPAAQPVIFSASGTGPASQGSPPSQINVPNLMTLGYVTDSCGGCRALITSSAGAEIDLSSLTTINVPDMTQFVDFSVDSGGSIDLSLLAINSRLRFTVSGASALDLPAFDGELTGGTFTLSGDATLTLDAVDSVSGTVFNMSGNAMLELATSATLTTGSFNLSGNAQVSLPLVQTITGTNIIIANTSVFDAPALTAYNSGLSAGLTVRDTAVFNAPNLADIDNSQFATTGGGVIDLPVVITYDWSGPAAQPVIFSASGTGPTSQGSPPSQINAPNLMTLGYVTDSCGGCRALITSSAGAEIDLSSLTTINVPDGSQFVDFSMDSGGTIDLGMLAANARLRFTVSGASALDLPAFDGTLAGGTFTLSGDSRLTLDAVDSVSGTVFNMSGNAMLELATSATLTTGSFNLLGNAQVSLPLVQTITGTNIIIANTSVFDAPALTAYNSGLSAGLTVRDTAVFNAPNLADIDNSQFATTGGGVIDLPVVITYDWSGPAAQPVIFSASGTGPTSQGSPPSQINAPNLMTLGYVTDTCGGCRALITSSSGAEIDLSSLTTISVPDLSQFVDIILDSSSIDLDALEGTSRMRFTVSGTAALSLPGVTTTATGASYTLNGDAMVVLDNAMTLSASTLNLNTNSVFMLTNAMDLMSSSITLNTNSQFDAPALDAVASSTTIINGTSMFAAPMLTAYTASNLTVRDESAFDAPNLADIDQSQFATTAGGVIDLPAVTSYSSTNNPLASQPVAFNASGVGPSSLGSPPSQILVPNLMTLQYLEDVCNGCSIFIAASAGGMVDVSGMTTINLTDANDRATLTADGTGTIIDASALTTFPAARVTFTETNGGMVLLP